MKYAVEMGSDAHEMYTKFHNYLFRYSKVVFGGRGTQTQQRTW
jgi:hypothetical protein